VQAWRINPDKAVAAAQQPLVKMWKWRAYSTLFHMPTYGNCVLVRNRSDIFKLSVEEISNHAKWSGQLHASQKKPSGILTLAGHDQPLTLKPKSANDFSEPANSQHKKDCGWTWNEGEKGFWSVASEIFHSLQTDCVIWIHKDLDSKGSLSASCKGWEPLGIEQRLRLQSDSRKLCEKRTTERFQETLWKANSFAVNKMVQLMIWRL